MSLEKFENDLKNSPPIKQSELRKTIEFCEAQIEKIKIYISIKQSEIVVNQFLIDGAHKKIKVYQDYIQSFKNILNTFEVKVDEVKSCHCGVEFLIKKGKTYYCTKCGLKY